MPTNDDLHPCPHCGADVIQTGEGRHPCAYCGGSLSAELPTELDQLASYALTALTDPAAIPPPWVYAVERAERRATAPDDDPRADFAVGCLNRLINLMNPAELTMATAAQALSVLGQHMEEIRERMADAANWAGIEDHRYAYGEGAESLALALDTVDAVISMLESQGVRDDDE